MVELEVQNPANQLMDKHSKIVLLFGFAVSESKWLQP